MRNVSADGWFSPTPRHKGVEINLASCSAVAVLPEAAANRSGGHEASSATYAALTCIPMSDVFGSAERTQCEGQYET